jgi:DNA-directed RNA polymerase subunit RPC12/RpoP
VSVAATTIPKRRSMECGRCGAEWSVPVSPFPTRAVHCPYCEAHICGCGCGADLRGMRADAIYEAEGHYKRLKRASSTDVPQTKTVADARALQEDAKAHWSMVVDEAIVRHFRRDPSGTFHADDLEALGIPDDHRNVIGSQIAKWVNRKRMVECGRRASSVPSRNGAKSNEYRLTERGVRLVAGLHAENPEGTAGGVESPPMTPAPSTGHSLPGGEPHGAGSSLSVESDDEGLHDGHLPSTSPYSSDNEWA